MAAAALVGGCHRLGGSAPTGQVIATVDGREITASELQLELNGASAANPEAQRKLETGALQSIVNRAILSQAARDQKLDRLPVFAIIKQKAIDLALIDLLQQKTAASLSPPSGEEVSHYMADHPDSFAQRKQFVVDQLIVPQLPPDLMAGIQSLRTSAAIAQLLTARRVPFQHGVGALDGATSDPELVKRISGLPSGDAFVVPSGPGLTVNTVRETHVEPFTGSFANDAARQFLQQTRAQQLVQAQLDTLLKEGAKSVKYNQAFAAPVDPAGRR